jgi:hypothetical protein
LPASVTACAQIWSTAVPSGEVVFMAMRSLPGSRAALTANGSSGAGAQVASPGS